MESQPRVVVVVEETDASRAALEWAVRNFLRGGDFITLLHVYPPTRSAKRKKRMRLRGFQLALSFKDLCTGIAEAKIEITVVEGDQAASVVSLVERIGASTLIIGLHDQSFVYRRATGIHNLGGCRILGIKQHSTTYSSFIDAELSQVEITTLCKSEPKSPFTIFPCPIWKRSRKRRQR